MTLGGMSLAVGILVDDATVELENIHRNLGQGKPLVSAILDGAREIAVPAFVSTVFVSGTTLSVPALMGTILCVGVATANSILLVSFANDVRHAPDGGIGLDARAAALLAGTTRLRPVLMTALAMILGMLPMAIGLGEGAEQNAPLGRAVIGGLALATLTTLFFVPSVYSLLRRKPPLRNDAEVSA
jgi:multidrug efflux pump subunit AcrB